MTSAEQALRTEPVQKAQRALEAERRRKSDLLEQYNEAKEKIESREEKLTETRADRQLEEATDEDVEQAKQALQEAEEEAAELRAEYTSSERAIAKIEDRLEYRKTKALEEAKLSLKEEYLSRLEAAQEAAQEAEEALERAGEVGDKLSDRRIANASHDDKPVPGDVRSGVTLHLHNRADAPLGKALDKLSTGVGRTKSQIQVISSRMD